MRHSKISLQSASLPALAAALLVAGLVPASASAQDSVAEEDAAAEEPQQQIIVTGSRIARDPNATAPLPISTLDSEALRNFGSTDATAALRQIPALISSGTVADSIERGAGGIGQATLNLRQLGANRTLVLVDGWRHVSGVAGSQTVDVATIPNALIERVEVLTGGASAVYGADAVTGVVNYVLKRDFEGLTIDAQMGVSSKGDGRTARIEGVYGKNFAEGRGNVTFAAGYTKDNEILLGEREFTANNGRGNNSATYQNPLRRFQQGDINPATMPNFANRFRIGGSAPASGRFPYGGIIPTPAEIATLFPGGITAAEQALVDRAAAAPLFVIGADPRFAISSNQGLIYRADFARFPGLDINNNGTADCNESYIGRVVFGGGGCYITDSNGNVQVFRDGLIAGTANQFGGDGAVERTNNASLIPGSERIYGNLRSSFEFSNAARVWVDAKYARNEATSRNDYNTFYDTLFISPQNPFIPAVLRADANAAGGLLVSRDFTDLGPNITKSVRETYRIVGGLDGEITPHLKYELVGNYGRTDNRTTTGNSVRYDRLFAAIDVITDPRTGQPTCRSNVNPTALHPGSEAFPVIAPGFFTFTPGPNSGCVPANLFRGANSVSPEAAAWITTPTTSRARLEQLVFTGLLNGDTGGFFNLPGGAVSFSLGAEYRKEESQTELDPLVLGLLPAGSPAGPAGTFIGSISPNQSLIFDATRNQNAGGEFDVVEVFGEVLLPILSDTPFFHDLSVGAAGRYADYSTIGGAFTWNVNGTWAPIEDIRLRGTYSVAIRAPNISELFSPELTAFFRPADPCSQSAINSLIANNDPAAQNRLNNCRADGIPAGYEDPLTARFAGVSGGNPNLQEETATTWTAGAVVQPRFIPGLTLSADYYSIKIEDAIAAVSAQDIVNNCYDLPTFPNNFCTLFTRNRTATSPTFLGFNFLRQSQINFAALDTRGVDAQINYAFSLGENNFNLSVNGNWTERLNRFFDPRRPDVPNPGLRELGAPEFSGFGNVTWNRGDFTLNYGVQYIESTAVASVIQIERIDFEFGPAGFAPDYWIHNLAFSLDATDEVTFYGGINNLTDEIPYLSSSAYPVSGMGRSFFLGVTGRF